MFARNSLRLISHSGLIKAIEAKCSYVWMLDDLGSQANTTKTSLPMIKSTHGFRKNGLVEGHNGANRQPTRNVISFKKTSIIKNAVNY